MKIQARTFLRRLPVGLLLGLQLVLPGSARATNYDTLVPLATPFGYNVGIDYETDIDGRTGRSITADLDQITQYFELVRTYHDTASPNSTTPVIDPDQLAVMQYAMAHPALHLVMGTFNSALVTGTTGSFTPGLMDSPIYTDAWVQMLIAAFGGNAAAVRQSLKTILLGNELDFPGTFIPGPTDPNYATYVNNWIPDAFANLQSSLAKAGLGDIPVSLTLAFSPVSAPAGNTVSTAIPQYVAAHWSAGWNGNQPFVLYNQYSNSSPPNFFDITGYLGVVAASPVVGNEVFLGETGVQSPGGNDAEEAAFYQQMFAALGKEQANGGVTAPMFAFQAFNLPEFTQTYGLFAQGANAQPAGLKPGISIPSWVAEPIAAGSMLSAATLPSSRSVEIGVSATAFSTIVNTGAAAADSCQIAPIGRLPFDFTYQATDPATNKPVGAPDLPVDIAAGAAQSFVVAFKPGAAFAPAEIAFSFTCAGLPRAAIEPGLDTLLLSSSSTPVPDIVALAATPLKDGIVHVTGTPARGAFAVAAVNLGAAAAITATANTGSASLPLAITLCETDPASGQCTSPIGGSVTATVAANATPSFAVFVSATGPVAFDPAASRITVQFADSGAAVRGATSVAVETQ
jgi:hypothetical protein